MNYRKIPPLNTGTGRQWHQPSRTKIILLSIFRPWTEPEKLIFHYCQLPLQHIGSHFSICPHITDHFSVLIDISAHRMLKNLQLPKQPHLIRLLPPSSEGTLTWTRQTSLLRMILQLWSILCFCQFHAYCFSLCSWWNMQYRSTLARNSGISDSSAPVIIFQKALTHRKIYAQVKTQCP